jgi:hypothetical protein
MDGRSSIMHARRSSYGDGAIDTGIREECESAFDYGGLASDGLPLPARADDERDQHDHVVDQLDDREAAAQRADHAPANRWLAGNGEREGR